jgi:hypothetical protein
MSLPKVFEDALEYVSGAVSRIFAPRDDDYPTVGTQPFEGEIKHKQDRK